MTLILSTELVLLLVSILILVQLLCSEEKQLEDSQLTSLESGFESNSSSKLLSASFFFLAILFVLFDMELILLFPSVLFSQIISIKTMKAFMVLMLMILFTLLMEWSWFGLKWQV